MRACGETFRHDVWGGYQSLQCSLYPRWQQTQACIDNGPASSEKSFSNCLWCWPTHRQDYIHSDGMKTWCSCCTWKHLDQVKWRDKCQTAYQLNWVLDTWMTWCVMTNTLSTRWHTLTVWEHTLQQIHGECHPDLLDIFFGPDVRRVYQGTHDFQVAVDNKGLVWPVCVDAHPAVVVHRIWQLTTLPQHLVVAFKLTWVGSLQERKSRWCMDKQCLSYFWKISWKL